MPDGACTGTSVHASSVGNGDGPTTSTTNTPKNSATGKGETIAKAGAVGVAFARRRRGDVHDPTAARGSRTEAATTVQRAA